MLIKQFIYASVPLPYTIESLTASSSQVTVHITKSGGDTGGFATLLLASYFPTGALMDVKTYPISLQQGESKSITLPLNYVSEGLLSAFIWSNTTTVTPLAKALKQTVTASFSTPTPNPTFVPTPTLTPLPSPTPLSTSVPSPTPIPKSVMGFTTYYYTGDTSSYNSIVANSSTLDEIVTATHVVAGNGNITGTVPTNQLTYSQANNIHPLLMIGNNFDGSIAKILLESPSNRLNFINQLKSILSLNHYQGVNIDLEGVYGSNRSHYTTLIQELYTALKPLGYFISASVPAKTTDSPSNTWSYAYDYAALSQTVDQLVLMAYDEHYPGGSPGPIASISWVTNVVNYALTVVPKEKIILGVAAYGYDWSTKGTKAYGVDTTTNLATTYGSNIIWDNTSQSPYFTYTDSDSVLHTVWFENAYSLAFKLDLVNQKGLRGIAIWRLGLENSLYWTKIRTKFNLN